jgi:hypothetical protein
VKDEPEDTPNFPSLGGRGLRGGGEVSNWFKKWFWPTTRRVLPIVIVTAGAVFVVLAVIFKLMDAESARYLLSAIVQSLAALLAIIFAGVAILWGQEHQASMKLEEIRKEYVNIFKEKIETPAGKNQLIEAFRKAFLAAFFDDGKIKWQWSVNSKHTHNLINTLRQISSWAYYFETDSLENRQKIRSDFRQIAVSYPRGGSVLPLYNWQEYEEQLYDLEAFDYFMGRILVWAGMGIKEVDEGSSEAKVFMRCSEVTKAHDTRYLLLQFLRGKEARGPRFKTLISLYSITIAGGMVLLSVLKAGICESQATWYAAFPLGFGICAVALTFVYLANIVSGEKDG